MLTTATRQTSVQASLTVMALRKCWKGEGTRGPQQCMTHLHGGLNIYGAHKAVLGDAERDLNEWRIPHFARYRPTSQLLTQPRLRTHQAQWGRRLTVTSSSSSRHGPRL